MKVKTNKGFSLVELIVVIAIMAIIAAVAVPVYNIYIEKTEKANDKKLVSDILYALKLGSESSFDANGQSSFIVNGQFSQGIEIPIGFVVISNETLTTTNAKGETVSGTMISLSNDANKDPIHEALVASFGSDYSSNILLNHNNWSVSTIGTSSLHNASAGMVEKIDDVGDLMIALDGIVDSMTSGDYEDTGDMIISVAQRIVDYDNDGTIEASDKEDFIQIWAGATEKSTSSYSFGLNGREYYSAVRLAYSTAFAEYVRSNYSGSQDANTLANAIANYGQSAGDLAYQEAYELAGGGWKGKIAGEAAKYAANTAAPDATFPYAATNKAFEDSSYAGYGDQDCKDLYAEWIEGQDEKDAAMFYDTMLTIATDGKSYADANSTDEFVEWFKEQAQNYSENFSSIETLVKGKSAIVVVVYYKDAELICDIYSSEADPRN